MTFISALRVIAVILDTVGSGKGVEQLCAGKEVRHVD
jgi:hypothetical protein